MTTQLSGRQAAKVLNVSHETIYRWVREGRLEPAGSVGKTILFDAAYIERVSQDIHEGRFDTNRSKATAQVA
jgi:excisionase family DNA binding protein